MRIANIVSLIAFAVLTVFVSPSHARGLYFAEAERCEAGVKSSCLVLQEACELRDDARACFHLAYSLGLQGDDEGGLKYLGRACAGGLVEVCSAIPAIRKRIEETQAQRKVKL